MTRHGDVRSPGRDTNAVPYRASVVAVATIAAALLIDRMPTLLWHVPGWLSFSRRAPELAMLAWKLAQVPLCVVAVMLILRRTVRGALHALGLTAPIAPALVLGLVCSIPVLAVAAWAHTRLNPHATLVSSLRTALGSGLGEEVLYRGLLFLVLYRFARWPFWAAALANAIPWVVGHLYQSQQTGLSLLAGTAEVAATFAVLGALAAWMLVRWDDNLWVLVGIHGFGNLWWHLLAEDTVPLYGAAGWIMRLGLIATAIAVTLVRRQLPTGVAAPPTPV
jgi:membrane protease YdiL (CAAX protease family)